MHLEGLTALRKVVLHHEIIKLKDKMKETKRKQLVEEGHKNMDLPEGSTSSKMSSPLPSMQRQTTLKWLCHSTLLYIRTLKFIPA